MIKNKYLAFVLFVVVFIVFWSILKVLFDKDTYQFTLSNLLIPLITGIVVGYFTFLNGHGN